MAKPGQTVDVPIQFFVTITTSEAADHDAAAREVREQIEAQVREVFRPALARVAALEAERIQYFRWAYAAVVALARDELEVANAAAEPGQWPAQQSWEGLGGTSRAVFMRRARERAGIDHDEFLAPVRDGSIDVEDLHGPMPDPERGDPLAKLEAERDALEAEREKLRAVALALADNLERPDGSPSEDSSEALALARKASEVMAVALEKALGLPPQTDWNPIGAALRELAGGAS